MGPPSLTETSLCDAYLYQDTTRALCANGSDYLQQFETVTHSPVLRAGHTVRYEEGLTSL